MGERKPVDVSGAREGAIGGAVMAVAFVLASLAMGAQWDAKGYPWLWLIFGPAAAWFVVMAVLLARKVVLLSDAGGRVEP